MCEQLVIHSGIDYTIVRASWFNQNFSENFLLEPIQAGFVALPQAEVEIPFVDTEDIAEVAVEALINDAHNGEIYQLTGPRKLTFRAAIEEIAAASQREIQFTPISIQAYSDAMRSHGLPEDFVWLISYLFTEVLGNPDNEEITKVIMKHGLEQSEVMETASWLTDVYGPRLTGSPMLDQATQWAQTQLKDWGMSNVHLHEWGPFGRGWQLDHFEMHASGNSYWPVMAYPKAWSPSVKGSADLIYLDIEDEADIEKYIGKLTGKFVLMDTIRKVEPPFEAMGSRRDVENLFDMATAGTPTPRPRIARHLEPVC